MPEEYESEEEMRRKDFLMTFSDPKSNPYCRYGSCLIIVILMRTIKDKFNTFKFLFVKNNYSNTSPIVNYLYLENNYYSCWAC